MAIFRAVQPAVCRALLWLRSQQLADGSFGLTLPGGSSFPSASLTADAVYVLALLGEDPAGPGWSRGGHSALDALRALAPDYVGTDAGQAGKVARAVALAGGDPHAFAGMDLIATIEAAYDPATGRYHPSLLYRHTVAMEGLLRSGRTVPGAALTALRNAQLTDGGWFWAFDAERSDVDSTGRVLHLLAGLLDQHDAVSFARAGSYLAAVQGTDAGWGVAYLPGPSNANSTALAVAGLRSAGFDPQAYPYLKNGRGGLDRLLSFQEPTGAFAYIDSPGQEESRLMATLDALTALAPMLEGQPACRVRYLPLVLK